jgi:hypothetical protein
MPVQLSPIDAHERTIGQIFSDTYAFEIPPISVRMPGRRTRHENCWPIFSMQWTTPIQVVVFIS